MVTIDEKVIQESLEIRQEPPVVESKQLIGKVSKQDKQAAAEPVLDKKEKQPKAKEDVNQLENKEAIVNTLNKTTKIFGNGIRFVLEQDDDSVVVEVFNKDTGEIIRRIPPEDVLKSVDNISELVGLLIDKVG